MNWLGVRRLMAAVLLRAILDVYSTDEQTRSEARAWLEEAGEIIVQIYQIKMDVPMLTRWIRNGFPREAVHFRRYGYKKVRRRGENRLYTD